MSKLLYDGWHKIEEIKTMANGKLVTREKLHLKSAVAAIVTDSVGKIGLVQQYRPILEDYTYELPAGVLDNPELTPYGIMMQELQEECMINREDIESFELAEIPYFHQVVGSSDASTTLYRITLNDEMLPSYPVNDADVESALWVELEVFECMVLNGEIRDSKTLLAYFILKDEMY